MTIPAADSCQTHESKNITAGFLPFEANKVDRLKLRNCCEAPSIKDKPRFNKTRDMRQIRTHGGRQDQREITQRRRRQKTSNLLNPNSRKHYISTMVFLSNHVTKKTGRRGGSTTHTQTLSGPLSLHSSSLLYLKQV